MLKLVAAIICIASPALAQQNAGPGNSPSISLSDEQCWNVLDSYYGMGQVGQNRLKKTASACEKQVAGKTRPLPTSTPPGTVFEPSQAPPFGNPYRP